MWIPTVTFLTTTVILQVLPQESNPPLLDIPSLGKIQGHESQTFEGRRFYAFEGIPYAQPPVDTLRFQEAQTVKPWNGTLVADSIYTCLQPDLERRTLNGTEDCLYLNIYTPNLDKNAKLDVIVFIHGGAFFVSNGGSYGPDFILNENIVYVNLNYRLGVLGFLSTENDLVPGNNGIKDQILALQWIQEHIINFGGNPDSVTISGGSAGSASVHIHMLTPKSKGLFHKAIARSGVVTNPWSLSKNHLKETKRVAEGVGCPTDNLTVLVDCLKEKPAEDLVLAMTDFDDQRYISQLAIASDNWASDPVFPQHPYLLMKYGKIANDVPIMFSHVTAEGVYPANTFYNDTILEMIDSQWNKQIPVLMLFNQTVPKRLQKKVSRRIRHHYLGNQMLTKATYKHLVEAFGDRHFLHQIYKSMHFFARALTSPVYFNLFDYEGAETMSSISLSDRGGVGHYADNGYVFKMNEFSPLTTDNDKTVVKAMVNIFTTFARTGKLESISGWQPLEKNQSEFAATGLFVNRNGSLTVEKRVFENLKFWDSLPIMENGG